MSEFVAHELLFQNSDASRIVDLSLKMLIITVFSIKQIKHKSGLAADLFVYFLLTLHFLIFILDLWP